MKSIIMAPVEVWVALYLCRLWLYVYKECIWRLLSDDSFVCLPFFQISHTTHIDAYRLILIFRKSFPTQLSYTQGVFWHSSQENGVQGVKVPINNG